MSSIEETAYPRLLDDIAPQELEQLYAPTAKERAMLQLKLMQRLGYSVPLASVPPRSRRMFAAS